jgi:hypothetical protein
MVFYPNRITSSFMYSGTTGAPYSFAPAAVQAPQGTQIISLYEKTRCLAAGVRIRPVQSATTNQGTITAALLGSERAADAAAFGITTGSAATFGYNEYGSFQSAIMVPFSGGACCFWRPQDPNSFIFNEAQLTDTATSVATLQGIPFMVVGLAGTAATASFIVEYIVHYEGYILGGNAGVIAVDKAPATSFTTVQGGVDKLMPSNVTAKAGPGDEGFNAFQPPGKAYHMNDSTPPSKGGQGSSWSVPQVLGGIANGVAAARTTYEAAVSFGDELAELMLMLL